MSGVFPPEPGTMGLVGHLAELRRRILVCLCFFAAAAACLSPFGQFLFGILKEPARGAAVEFVFTAPAEALAVYFSVVLLAAFVVSFPVVLYQFWAFVSPAFPFQLRRRFVIWFILSLVSFLTGVVFAYAVLLPSAMTFLVDFGRGIAVPMIALSRYVSFAVTIILAGGVVFEIPCFMALLSEAGLVNVRMLTAGRRYAVLAVFVLAAVITPTQDPFNMLMLALPMLLLFEIGVLVCAVVEKNKARAKEKV